MLAVQSTAEFFTPFKQTKVQRPVSSLNESSIKTLPSYKNGLHHGTQPSHILGGHAPQRLPGQGVFAHQLSLQLDHRPLGNAHPRLFRFRRRRCDLSTISITLCSFSRYSSLCRRLVDPQRDDHFPFSLSLSLKLQDNACVRDPASLLPGY